MSDWTTVVEHETRPFGRASPFLPEDLSNGAVEKHLREVRNVIGERAFCFRNAERTNRLLELVRLRLHRTDDVDAYAADIRASLSHQPPSAQLAIKDRRGHASLR